MAGTVRALGQIGAANAPGRPGERSHQERPDRRLRVEWNEAGREAGLPGTISVKSTPLSAKNRTMVASLDMAVNEVRFYQAASSSLQGHLPGFWYGFADYAVITDIGLDHWGRYATASRPSTGSGSSPTGA